jgi:hypothetical protein
MTSEKSEKLSKSTPAFSNLITAMAICRHFAVNTNQVNAVLAELGWIEKGPKGWLVTDSGKSMGGIQCEVKGTGAQFVRWPASILNDKKLANALAGEDDGTTAGQQPPPDAVTMTAGQAIDRIIAQTPDWRGKVFAQLRKIIHDADPEITEELKWMGAPVWSHSGMVALAGIFKDRVVLTIANGAHLPDPEKVFNDALYSNTGRRIAIHERDKINGPAIKSIISAGVDFNLAKARGKRGSRRNPE